MQSLIAWVLSKIFSAKTIELALRKNRDVFGVSVIHTIDLVNMAKAMAELDQATKTVSAMAPSIVDGCYFNGDAIH